jgi:peptide/nickel transport system permease protein
MSRERSLWFVLLVLAGLHGAVVFAGFVAPYGFATQNRDLPFAPPTHVHFVDARGTFHFRPFIYRWSERNERPGTYEEDQTQEYPVHWFVRGSEHEVVGLSVSRWHWFGVDEPARIFLIGSDAYGRDQLSRLLYGGQISLLAGLLAAALSLGVGLVLGAAAGYYGHWVDESIMRCAELFLALPWLYLLFAVRAFLPINVRPAESLLLVSGTIGLIGWARPARLIRGMVLGARERHYVLAARGFGASDFYLLRRHLVPQASGLLLTQAALLVPQYVLAEVTLSFLGLGVGEPEPSWGNMLANLPQYHSFAAYWWLYAPLVVLVAIFWGYYRLADALEERIRVVPL